MSSTDNMASIIIYNNEKEVEDFLRESNAIEQEYSEEALEDAKLAWEYCMQQDQLTFEVVLEIHRLLLRRLRPDIAGRLRKSDVYIAGNRKKYTDEALLLWELGSVLNAMWLSLTSEGRQTRIPFRLAAKAHVMFEECHPFDDGNGRTGRIVYNWHRLKLNLPIHVIHRGKEQGEYYLWFRNGV